MKVTVVGGGNVGTQMAAHFAACGHDVTVSASRPEMFGRALTIVDGRGATVLEGRIALATDDDTLAFSEAELVLVTVPAFGMRSVADRVARYAGSGMAIGLMPGTGGAECAFGRCIAAGASVFGVQRVPSVARLVERGRSVRCEGYRNSLHLACLPSSGTDEFAEVLAGAFGMPCEPLPNYLCVSLTPSNSILHTCRLYALFRDYEPGRAYGRVPLFYEEWDDEASDLLLACDDELQRACSALPELDLSAVRSLRAHYESETERELTAKIRSIDSLRGLETPVVAVGGGFAPDFGSRYFRADFPFGLELLAQFAEIVGSPAPRMREILDWFWGGVSPGKPERFDYAAFGIRTRDELLGFYGM